MNRGLERVAVLCGVVILVGSLLFGACLLDAPVALVVALALGVGATLLWSHFELSEGKPWLCPVVVGCTALGSIFLVEFSLRRNVALWFCPLLALAGAATTAIVLSRSRARCNLCNRRLGTQAVVFHCPRCRMDVCDETCWNFEHRRCQLCLEQRVPVLPAVESWWTRVAGPRARHGRCQICLGSPDQVDLRGCPNCRRTQCRNCWDFNNGECSRCGHPLPELPASLKMAVAKLADP